MNKTTFAALPLSLLAGLFLSACGGGGSESTASSASSAAKFSSTDDVAILVGGFGGTFEEFLFLRQQGGSKPGRKMQWGAMSKSAVAVLAVVVAGFGVTAAGCGHLVRTRSDLVRSDSACVDTQFTVYFSENSNRLTRPAGQVIQETGRALRRSW